MNAQNELDAAGIIDADLRESYLACRALNAKHGKTYFLATRLLPPNRRSYVHALYGFARYADEIVDDLDSTLTNSQKAQWLESWSREFFHDLENGNSNDQIAMAVIDTINRWDIPVDLFHAFIKSMTMDLTVTSYETFDDLMEYVYGSACVIGLQMLPLLEPKDAQAAKHAENLGTAFQLANFIRDVKEDIARGRIYLPLTELSKFEVSPDDLVRGVATPNIRAALKFQVDRVLELEASSRPGIAMLADFAQPCIETARELYCGIAREIATHDYDVFTNRVSVPMTTRIKVALPAYMQARKHY